jgi:branched-subunit amino acid transport protein
MDPKLLLPVWVLAALVISAVTSSLLYRGGGARGEAFEASALGGLLSEIGSLLFRIGVPLIALLTGTLSLDLFGLGKLGVRGDYSAGFTLGEWLRGAGEAAGAVALAWAVLWISQRGAGLTAPGSGPANAVLDAIRDEVQWLFFRAPGTLLTGDPLIGALSGFALAGFEWLLHPRFLSRNMTREQRWHLMTRVLCALVSGALYLGTRNIWLMLAADIVIRIFGERLAARRLTPAAALGA